MTASTARQPVAHIHFTPPGGSLAARALAPVLSNVYTVALLAGGATSQDQADHRLWIITPGATAPRSSNQQPSIVLCSPRVDLAVLSGVQAITIQLDYADIGRTLEALSSVLTLEAHTTAPETAAHFRAQDAFERAMCRPTDELLGKIADYSQALAFCPYYAEAFARRGGAYIALGELDAGIADCDELIRIAPGLSEAYYNRARAYSRREDFCAAIRDDTAALEHDPALVQAYLNRGAAHIYRRDYALAIADFSQALTLQPALADAYFNLSLAHAEVGDFEGAMTDYGKALKLSLNRAAPSPPGAGNSGQTLAYLERLLRRFPDHPAAASIRAETARLAARQP